MPKGLMPNLTQGLTDRICSDNRFTSLFTLSRRQSAKVLPPPQDQ